MDIVLKNLVCAECWVFMDDVIVFSKSAEEHAEAGKVLRRFDEANLQLHSGKCVFAQPKVQYLGRYTFREWSFRFHRQSESCVGISNPDKC